MTLETIYWKAKKPKYKKWYIGYKLYNGTKEKPLPHYFRWNQKNYLPINKIIKSTGVILLNKDKSSITYPVGFHVFNNLKDARKFCNSFDYTLNIWEVYFKDIVAEGTEQGYEICVAKTMQIMRCLK